MFGCASDATARASRSKRAVSASGASSLIATWRPSSRSSARQTSDIAARPSSVVEPVAAGDHGVGHGDTLCADRERLTHPGAGAGARARPRAGARGGAGARRGRGRTRHRRAVRARSSTCRRSRARRWTASRFAPPTCPATLPVVERIAAGRPARARARGGRGDGDLDRRRRPRGRRLRHPPRVCCPT